MAGRSAMRADDVFPYDHVIAYTDATLKNLGVDTIDLQQLHVWDDSWADAEDGRQAVAT